MSVHGPDSAVALSVWRGSYRWISRRPHLWGTTGENGPPLSTCAVHQSRQLSELMRTC
jgi:hypothetical protein